MRFRHVVAVLLGAITTLTLWLTPGAAALAQANQSNQELNRSAQLIAPEPAFKISIYPAPDTRKRRVGYGLGGQAVTVLEQVGSNDGTTWDHIKLLVEAETEGWVQHTYVSFQSASEGTQSRTSPQSSAQNRQPQGQTPQSQQPQTYRNQTYGGNQR